jgi:hypothetical protein
MTGLVPPSTFPPEPDEPLMHHRDYIVRSYRMSPDRLRIRGMVHDRKPAGTYIPDDPEPMSVHQMVVDLIVAFPSLEIVDAGVVMEVTPHAGCTKIEDTYQQLIGISIARGFTHLVRERFGGPRGCTHVGALLQAMAPVAIQSLWSMRSHETPVNLRNLSTSERLDMMKVNFNTCHVWDTEGELVARMVEGEVPDPPRWAVKRLEELGRPLEEWFDR